MSTAMSALMDCRTRINSKSKTATLVALGITMLSDSDNQSADMQHAGLMYFEA